MNIHLTGGTGLLGSHVAERLREAGHDVSVLHREGSDVRKLRSLGCRLVVGDVRESADRLAEVMAGAGVVIHAAAKVYGRGPWPRVRAVNVDGTDHVLRAAGRAGAKHAVHLSSVAVYGGIPGPVDETSPTDRPLPPSALYARSKREAEDVARAAAGEEGLALTILRPSALYGERDRLMAPRLARIVAWPVIPVMGHGRATLPVCYAGNVADAVLLAVERPPEARETRVYDVALDHPITQVELLEGMARALGRRPPRFLRVPAPLVRSAASLGHTLRLSVPGVGDLGLDRVARLALEDNPYRSRRIRRELGWTPVFTHEEGLARTARWLQAETESEDTRREEG
ncbi:MAG: NAD-dependent epimerase/dehydratase family protein [Gemmatimonadetes bacterium]|nr:NAD-dependent epimerase/dehydratase family protein [Gemmatimonadota bacterium]